MPSVVVAKLEQYRVSCFGGCQYFLPGARFDVVDVGREWLQTVPCVSALRTLASSWTQRSKTNASLAGEMLRDVMTDLDTLLSADAGFSFGAWIASARNLSNDTSGRDQLELNARAQVWLPQEKCGFEPGLRLR